MKTKQTMWTALKILSAMTACLLATIATGHAQDWPNRPITLVIPFPAGGNTDIVGRIVAQKLSEQLGQTIIVDNRGGVSGALGSDFVRRAPADGYVLLLSNAGSQGMAPAAYSTVTYDALNDFTHIGLIGSTPGVLIVNPSVPANTLTEFIAIAKAHPGQLQYATAGYGSPNHFAAESLKKAAGIEITHVPYKGAGPALLDVQGNHVPAMFDALPSSSGYIKSGAVRALAIAASARSAAFPQIPTFEESGYDIVLANWLGLSGPAGMPEAIAARLNRELDNVLSRPDVTKQLNDLGFDVQPKTMAEFRTYVDRDLRHWRDMVQQTGLKVD
jgi:tripartite-type tricarboxylate transporter receptor subunit TctC